MKSTEKKSRTQQCMTLCTNGISYICAQYGGDLISVCYACWLKQYTAEIVIMNVVSVQFLAKYLIPVNVIMVYSTCRRECRQLLRLTEHTPHPLSLTHPFLLLLLTQRSMSSLSPSYPAPTSSQRQVVTLTVHVCSV